MAPDTLAATAHAPIASLQTGVDGGLFDALVGVIPLVGTLLLFSLVLAFAAILYRHLRGGIRWPESGGDAWGDEDRGDAGHDDESDEGPNGDSTVRRGGDDDEWEFY
ncbi:hypothetical protein [Halogeometricum limi]|uniref:Uncharacterized protein n=1 Tax=Halogeometricum limi TaxID=555875 RepID=A0A1I6IFN4_9EURY|nr:hypothetical protein [Halogeometricum limi]SFR65449.1 hypothetical protein SAMN04488124_3191 [Halogeometricum limi]